MTCLIYCRGFGHASLSFLNLSKNLLVRTVSSDHNVFLCSIAPGPGKIHNYIHLISVNKQGSGVRKVDSDSDFLIAAWERHNRNGNRGVEINSEEIKIILSKKCWKNLFYQSDTRHQSSAILGTQKNPWCHKR